MTQSAFLISEIEQLRQRGLEFKRPQQIVDHFERLVADYFGAPFAVATDCCTHAIELVLRYLDCRERLILPRHTYMSVPMILDKVDIDYQLQQINWYSTYDVIPGLLIDAATLWQRDSYQPGTYMCLSFQYKKHLAIGRGGMILLDNHAAYERLRRMRHDGRNPDVDQWDDNVCELGYHYNMTPEYAARGIMIFEELRDVPWQAWNWSQYRDLAEFPIFKDRIVC
jgi:dTDP-4-amino-4,6-dideoxygalactose transaminase